MTTTCTGSLLSLLLAAVLLSGCAASEGPPAKLHPVYVESLALDERTDTPVVLLKERNGAGRELPIWIGMNEARSIAMALEDVALPRPNTHDLIKNLLDGIDGSVLDVVITELRGHTYYAEIRVRLNGRVATIDSRPSDAIAVAIRTGAPVFASDGVLERESDAEDDAPRLDIGSHGFAPTERAVEL